MRTGAGRTADGYILGVPPWTRYAPWERRKWRREDSIKQLFGVWYDDNHDSSEEDLDAGVAPPIGPILTDKGEFTQDDERRSEKLQRKRAPSAEEEKTSARSYCECCPGGSYG
jgi:hypothetical protein